MKACFRISRRRSAPKRAFWTWIPAPSRSSAERWAARSRRDDLAQMGVEQLLIDADLIVPRRRGSHLCSVSPVRGRPCLCPPPSPGRDHFPNTAPRRLRFPTSSGASSVKGSFFSTTISGTELKFNLRNDVHSVRDGVFRRDIPTFNEDAVREAVLNAVSHRDSIWLYGLHLRPAESPRRIEIVSPGGFPTDLLASDYLFGAIAAQPPPRLRDWHAAAWAGSPGQGADRMLRPRLKEGKLPPSFERQRQLPPRQRRAERRRAGRGVHHVPGARRGGEVGRTLPGRRSGPGRSHSPEPRGSRGAPGTRVTELVPIGGGSSSVSERMKLLLRGAHDLKRVACCEYTRREGPRSRDAQGAAFAAHHRQLDPTVLVV